MITWFRRRKTRKHCPHIDLHGIYGDEANHVGGYRLRCGDCGMLLEGPVSLSWNEDY